LNWSKRRKRRRQALRFLGVEHFVDQVAQGWWEIEILPQAGIFSPFSCFFSF
jgi:hypothetical protein